LVAKWVPNRISLNPGDPVNIETDIRQNGFFAAPPDLLTMSP